MILTKSAKTYTWVIDYDGNQINKIETPGLEIKEIHFVYMMEMFNILANQE